MLEGEVSHSCRHGSGPHSIKVCITKNSNDPGLFKRLAAKAGPKPPRRVDVWGHGFAYWLKRQWRRDDPVGILAGRFRKDPNWSKYRVLGLGYAAGITLLLERDACKRVLSLLAPVGRLSLTNYLFTSAVAAVIIYSWGFGLYGRLAPIVAVFIVLAAFAFQVLASHWWTQRFRFGPAEWCWRAMTYGAIPPMRVEAPPSQARP